jgi:hypothetical protein
VFPVIFETDAEECEHETWEAKTSSGYDPGECWTPTGRRWKGRRRLDLPFIPTRKSRFRFLYPDDRHVAGQDECEDNDWWGFKALSVAWDLREACFVVVMGADIIADIDQTVEGLEALFPDWSFVQTSERTDEYVRKAAACNGKAKRAWRAKKPP